VAVDFADWIYMKGKVVRAVIYLFHPVFAALIWFLT
jgi:hypothetical protein